MQTAVPSNKFANSSKSTPLAYLSLDGMLKCMSKPGDNYCTACWSGNYPIPVDMQTSKFGLERHQMKMFE